MSRVLPEGPEDWAMMPGELAVLERLARELEILNRHTELEQAEKTLPVLRPNYGFDDHMIPVSVQERSERNRRTLDRLRLELENLIATRPSLAGWLP
jgi:hypothetical protein